MAILAFLEVLADFGGFDDSCRLDTSGPFWLGEPKCGDRQILEVLADFGGFYDSGRLDIFGPFQLGEPTCGDRQVLEVLAILADWNPLGDLGLVNQNAAIFPGTHNRSNFKMFPDFRRTFLSTQNHANFKMCLLA